MLKPENMCYLEISTYLYGNTYIFGPSTVILNRYICFTLKVVLYTRYLIKFNMYFIRISI